MNSSGKILSILRVNEKNLEYYFQTFLTRFHTDEPKYIGMVVSREFVRYIGEGNLRKSAKESAHSIIRNEGGDTKDTRMFFALEEKIFEYFREYRREYMSRFRIFVNDLLR